MRASAPAPLLIALVLTCGGRSAPGELAALGPHGPVVARVNGEPVTQEQVELFARELHVGPREALERAIELRLLAQEAARRGLFSRADISGFAWHARLQLLLAREVEAAVTDESLRPGDVARVMDERAMELRAPATRRVVHFLAHHGSQPLARALAFRQRLLEVAGERPTEAQFNSVAAAMQGDNRYESVGPFDARGRMANGAGLVPEFVAATASLNAEAPLSEPITTAFGAHVVLLVSESAPSRVPIEEALAVVRRDMVLRGRSQSAQALVERLRQSHRVSVNAAAVSSVESLSRSP